MRIAVTGSNGQLGSALMRTLAGHELLAIDLPSWDITDLDATRKRIVGFDPDVIIHTAAATDVDGCERDQEFAFRVNVVGTRNMAVAALASDADLVHISTDYVFDGSKDGPYDEYDLANPLSAYGRTKAWAERTVRDHLQRFYIVRIAWLYGDGPRNFVRTVLRLARERQEITMVTDEWGSPTYAGDVASALGRLIRSHAYGIYHLPNSGVCSRYDWAKEILKRTAPHSVRLIPSTDYPRMAGVPKRVAMANNLGTAIGIEMRPWQMALGQYLSEGRGG